MKKVLVAEPTKSTPFVRIDYSNGTVEIKGRSCPENTLQFYRPLLHCVARFSIKPIKHVKIDLDFVYFNTSSTRCLFLLFKELRKLQSRGKKITINWRTEEYDEDMKEVGQDLQDASGMVFNFIEYMDENDLMIA